MYIKVSHLDIAPTIARIFGLKYQCEGKPITKVVRRFSGLKTIVLIIDSLGFIEFIKYRNYLASLSELIRSGFIFKCLTFARYTTPAIATILCGRRPEIHKIYRTGDVYKKPIMSIPEFLYAHGFKTCVIMEYKGASTFTNKVYKIVPINDRDDIIEFDNEVFNALIKLYPEDIDLTIAHIRSLDKYGYESRIIRYIDRNLNLIFNQYADKLIVVCGDHPPHTSKSRYVPLIFSSLYHSS